MRPKIKFLTVVWGEAYIERFATLSLPSLLAHGNLPALVAATDLEVVVMTARRDYELFENHGAFKRLRRICRVRFVDIGDLIVAGVYGITLTLAYARAVIACGQEMLQTHFVFMNADFVLADGSLRESLRHIADGRSIILAPSFRAVAEELEPSLRAAVDLHSWELAIAPRDLARMSLAHPHPTTEAKIVGQSLMHSTHPNQFFWRVDEGTLLGRYFLIFMLCLKPERVITSVNSFCDHCFIPELCPSGNEAVMGDSDTFFMLELQDYDQERHLLRPGAQSRADVARSLSEWTTFEHRRAARYDVVFHANDLPPAFENARAEARTFIDDLLRSLGKPLPHAFHPYWDDGIATYRELSAHAGRAAMPRELASPTTGRGLRASVHALTRRLLRGAVSRLHDLLMGYPPNVTLFHPDWLDFVHLHSAVASVAGDGRTLLIRNPLELRDPKREPLHQIELIDHAKFMRGHPDLLRQQLARCARAVIYFRGPDNGSIARLVARCNVVLPASATCHVLVHHAGDEPPHLRSNQRDTADPAGKPRASPISFVGGPIKSFNRSAIAALDRQIGRFGAVALLWVLPGFLVLAPVIALTNLAMRLRNPRTTPPRTASSVFIHIDR